MRSKLRSKKTRDDLPTHAAPGNSPPLAHSGGVGSVCKTDKVPTDRATGAWVWPVWVRCLLWLLTPWTGSRYLCQISKKFQKTRVACSNSLKTFLPLTQLGPNGRSVETSESKKVEMRDWTGSQKKVRFLELFSEKVPEKTPKNAEKRGKKV